MAFSEWYKTDSLGQFSVSAEHNVQPLLTRIGIVVTTPFLAFYTWRAAPKCHVHRPLTTACCITRH